MPPSAWVRERGRGQPLIGRPPPLGRNGKSCVPEGGCAFGPDHVSFRWC